MNWFPFWRRGCCALAAALVIALSGCSHSRERVLEVAYVSASQASLRDHVATVYQRVGTVKNGDRVEVLDHDRRFVKVRTSTGAEGWLEQRFVVSQQVFDRLQKLVQDNQNDPGQAQATTRNDTNLHVEPGRDTDHLYQISAGEKLELLKRATAEKSGSVASRPGMTAANAPDRKEAQPAIEDWWLARDSRGRVGWVLGRMVDPDVPLEIAQYAEGQRIVAFFLLNQVQDKDKKVPQYLTVLTEPKDGLPFDFNQIRVFTWNTKFHRYETAYRERMQGVLPVVVSQETFDKEGVLPVFVARAEDDSGNVTERKYKLNTPIVRRVYAPGEQPSRAGARRSLTRPSKAAH